MNERIRAFKQRVAEQNMAERGVTFEPEPPVAPPPSPSVVSQGVRGDYRIERRMSVDDYIFERLGRRRGSSGRGGWVRL